MKSNRNVKAPVDSSGSIPPKNIPTFFLFFFLFLLCEEVNRAPSHLFCSSQSTCSKHIRKWVTSRKGDKVSYSWQPFENLTGQGCKKPGVPLSTCPRYCTIAYKFSQMRLLSPTTDHSSLWTFEFGSLPKLFPGFSDRMRLNYTCALYTSITV